MNVNINIKSNINTEMLNAKIRGISFGVKLFRTTLHRILMTEEENKNIPQVG